MEGADHIVVKRCIHTYHLLKLNPQDNHDFLLKLVLLAPMSYKGQWPWIEDSELSLKLPVQKTE